MTESNNSNIQVVTGATTLLGLASLLSGNPLLMFGGGCMVGSSIASFVMAGRNESNLKAAIEELVTQHQNEIETRDSKIISLSGELDKKLAYLEKLSQANAILKDEVASVNQLLQARNYELAEARKELNDLNIRFNQVGEYSNSEALAIVNRTYENAIKKVKSMTDAFARNYPEIAQELEDFEEDLTRLRDSYKEKIHEYEQQQDLQYILDTGMLLTERMIDKSADIRIKCQTVLIKHLQMMLSSGVVSEEYATETIEKLAIDAGNIIQALQIEKEEIAQAWVNSNEQAILSYNANYEEMSAVAREAVAAERQLRAEVERLNLELVELRKPMQMYGGSSEAVMANKISDYYYSHYKYLLDAITWEETDTEIKILYSIRRNPGLSLRELYADNCREQLASYTNALYGTLPEWDLNYQNVTATLKVITRKASKKVLAPSEIVKDFRTTLAPSESFIEFIKQEHHVGLWGETGTGKTTLIANTIGAMKQLMPTASIHSTIPKIDDGSAKLFSRVDYLGVPKSIFGLLTAALEVQFRIYQNEQAYLSGQIVKSYDPIIYFIDEINLIFTRWGKVNEADLESALQEFISTLSGERLEYFTQYMVTEIRNYKNELAKKLLLFIWQTGRSLNVKTLVAGQNLQPGAFRMMINDIKNCAYIALGDSRNDCVKYKVKSRDVNSIESHLNGLEEAQRLDKDLRFTALFCSTIDKSYLSLLPAPSTYKMEACPKTSNLDSKLDNCPESVQTRPSLEASTDKAFEDFVQMSKLPKKYQNLGYEGYVQLWDKLPKKPNGEVHKTKAYDTTFKVSRSEDRKIISQFIDYLESLCRGF